MFLLVPAHPGNPRQKGRKMVVVCCCYIPITDSCADAYVAHFFVIAEPLDMSL